MIRQITIKKYIGIPLIKICDSLLSSVDTSVICILLTILYNCLFNYLFSLCPCQKTKNIINMD